MCAGKHASLGNTYHCDTGFRKSSHVYLWIACTNEIVYIFGEILTRIQHLSCSVLTSSVWGFGVVYNIIIISRAKTNILNVNESNIF